MGNVWSAGQPGRQGWVTDSEWTQQPHPSRLGPLTLQLIGSEEGGEAVFQGDDWPPKPAGGTGDHEPMETEEGGGRAARAWARGGRGASGHPAHRGRWAQRVERAEVWSQTAGTTSQQLSVLEARPARLRRGPDHTSVLWAAGFPSGRYSGHRGHGQGCRKPPTALQLHPPPSCLLVTPLAFQSEGPPSPGHPRVDRGHPHLPELTPHILQPHAPSRPALISANTRALPFKSVACPGCKPQEGRASVVLCLWQAEGDIPSNILHDEGQPALGGVAVPAGT